MQIAIIGSGKIGATLARRFTQTGHEATLVNWRGAASLAPLVAELGPHAHAADDIASAAAEAELIVLAVPFFLYDQLPAGAVAGTIVVDATNCYPGRDGHVAELDEDRTTSSELIAAHLTGAQAPRAS